MKGKDMTLPVTCSRIALPYSAELRRKGIRLGSIGSSCSALEEPNLTIISYLDCFAVGQPEQVRYCHQAKGLLHGKKGWGHSYGFHH